MFISTSNENATTYNAVGFIEGCIEPGEQELKDIWK